MINYHNKTFRPFQNTSNGEVTAQTLFRYQQVGELLYSEYQGGDIVKGHLIGKVNEQGIIDMRYHHVNTKGELMTGKCQSTPEVLPSGKIRLHEKWQWTSGDHSNGESILEEI